MSRVANLPIIVPDNVKVDIKENKLFAEGKKGRLDLLLPKQIRIKLNENILSVSVLKTDRLLNALAGTYRALVNNVIIGVSIGFEKKLVLQGVGYRAKLSGNVLSMNLGFSHSVDYKLPEGIKADIPSQTEITISGVDKQRVGQVASEVRAYRPPEPYKGKGVKYADEVIRRKEAKKK